MKTLPQAAIILVQAAGGKKQQVNLCATGSQKATISA